MKWKNLPTWLKGGIIGLVTGILTLLGCYLYQLWFEHTKQGDMFLAVIRKINPLEVLIVFPFVIAATISSLIGLRGTSLIFKLPYANALISLLGLLIYFLIGAFIGWIIEKLKSKKKV